MELFRKPCSILAAACLLFACSAVPAPRAGAAGTQTQADASAGAMSANSYAAYRQQHADAIYTGRSLEIPVDTVSPADGISVVTEYEGKTGPILQTTGDSTASFAVDIPETGWYTLHVVYYPMPGSGGTIQRAVLIDGEIPYDEAGTVEFRRVYADDPTQPRQEEISPTQVETPQWQETDVRTLSGFYDQSLAFYLTAGAHTLSLRGVAEPMAIAALTLMSQEETAPAYEQALADWLAEGAEPVQGALEAGIAKKQAEDAWQKSDRTLYPVNDNTSPANEPYHYADRKINVISSTKWKEQGQWISWQIEVPESGLYHIGFRSRQNTVKDIASTRCLYIDGELPFREAANLTFAYADKWTVQLAGGETPYWFYLEKGTRTITLEVTLGELSEILMQAYNGLNVLNEACWELMTFIGSQPDLNRDYNIAGHMPDVVETLAQQAENLAQVSRDWVAMTGAQDANVAQLDQIVFQLEQMVDDPEDIPRLFLNFRDNLSNFANMLMNARQRPLSLDYLFLAEEDAELPQGDVGFWAGLKYGFLKFFNSFVQDYNTISGADAAGQDPITVWIGNGLTGGRDQAVALNNLIQQDFAVQYGLPVKLEIVPPTTVLTATIAGRGPDVALQLNAGDPANYAMRGAVVDLSQMPDFDEVSRAFSPDAFTQYTYLGGIYALPETVSYPVMFYRKDILERLGVDIESIWTWDDLIAILPVIQGSNMNISLQPNVNSYYMFLYQMGSTLYKDGDTATNLDSREALDAFNFWMNFYVNYNLPMTYNFVQRFRTGEVPIGIEDYTQYNLLQLSAPEIRGQWGMTAIPGMRGDDGTINSVAPLTGTGCVLMEASDNQEGAWTFMKWYVSSAVQYRYGQDLESVMGIGARYNSANLEALYQLPWREEEKQALMKQGESLQGVPEVPGGYLTARNIGFAMNTVYNTKADARMTLLSYVDQMNQEIRLKRREFGLEP